MSLGPPTPTSPTLYLQTRLPCPLLRQPEGRVLWVISGFTTLLNLEMPAKSAQSRQRMEAAEGTNTAGGGEHMGETQASRGQGTDVRKTSCRNPPVPIWLLPGAQGGSSDSENQGKRQLHRSPGRIPSLRFLICPLVIVLIPYFLSMFSALFPPSLSNSLKESELNMGLNSRSITYSGPLASHLVPLVQYFNI